MSDLIVAEKLWGALHDALANADAVIAEIIRTKAWEPLGYKTFAAAWQDRMSDVRLAGAVKARVLYALYDEGVSPDEAALTMAGVGPVEARLAHEQYEIGVPVGLVTFVRGYTRKTPPATPRTLHVKLDPDVYEEYVRVAEEHERTLREEVRLALEEWFGC